VNLPSARTLGLWLGAVYLVFGVIEVYTHRSDTVGALAYWGISLLGGGALVVAGSLLRVTNRTQGLALLTVGVLIATSATLWTLLIPVVALVTVVAAYRADRPAVGAA
jgi:hypothetical protein